MKLAATIATAVLVATAAGSAAGGGSASCPRGLLPLADSNPVGAAARAALRRSRPAARPQVVSAALATADRQRGAQAKAACGTRVWRRTVVVHVTERALLPAQSAAQRVYFVGRFETGYRVWEVVR